MLLATVVESVGEGVATEAGEVVAVGDVAVTEGEVVAEVKLSGVGDAVATGDGEVVTDGDEVVVGDVAVVELGVVVATLSGVGEGVVIAFGEEVGVDPRDGEGLTVGRGEGDKVAIGLGDKVGEGVVMGVTVSATGVDAVDVTAEEESVVSASLLAVVDVGFKSNDPTKVAIITPHKPNNIPVFIAGDISSDDTGGAGSAEWVNSGSEGVA